MYIHCSHWSCDPPLPRVIKADWSLSGNELSHLRISPTGRATQTIHLREDDDRNWEYIFMFPKMKCIIIPTNPTRFFLMHPHHSSMLKVFFQYGKISISIPLAVTGHNLKYVLIYVAFMPPQDWMLKQIHMDWILRLSQISQYITLNIFKHCHLGYSNLMIYSPIKFHFVSLQVSLQPGCGNNCQI